MAAFTLSERSPLPQALSAKDLPGGRTDVLNVRRIKRIDQHPPGSGGHSSSESISDFVNWLNLNGDADILNASDDNREANIESHIELDNGIEAPGSPEHRHVSAAPNVPRLIRPTWWTM